MTSIVWFRDDLRVADNPALLAAAARGGPVVCVYVLDEVSPGIRPLGGAAKWWLHGSLASLGEQVQALGSQFVLRQGPAAEVIARLVKETDAAAVYWNRRYGGPERTIDTSIKTSLRKKGVIAESFGASLLFEPWTVRTGGGTPYAVFTPFWRACQALPAPRAPLAAPPVLEGGPELASDELGLLPRVDWAAGLRERWAPGEPSAHERLHEFLTVDLAGYDRARDEPSAGATSELSPRLRWGELSPHTVWHVAAGAPGTAGFLSELGWREFAWHTLFNFPELATRNWRASFDAFAWDSDATALGAWQRGETGIPLVDAGMRELWYTGFMHNRVRMVTASFLTKNLLTDWRLGEAWFWDTLVDADAAANPFNWQWVAGSGADAAPYFRVFNPELQAKKFDGQGLYVNQWAPLRSEPIVDLAESRRRALAAYEALRRG